MFVCLDIEEIIIMRPVIYLAAFFLCVGSIYSFFYTLAYIVLDHFGLWSSLYFNSAPRIKNVCVMAFLGFRIGKFLIPPSKIHVVTFVRNNWRNPDYFFSFSLYFLIFFLLCKDA